MVKRVTRVVTIGIAVLFFLFSMLAVSKVVFYFISKSIIEGTIKKEVSFTAGKSSLRKIWKNKITLHKARINLSNANYQLNIDNISIYGIPTWSIWKHTFVVRCTGLNIRNENEILNVLLTKREFLDFTINITMNTFFDKLVKFRFNIHNPQELIIVQHDTKDKILHAYLTFFSLIFYPHKTNLMNINFQTIGEATFFDTTRFNKAVNILLNKKLTFHADITTKINTAHNADLGIITAFYKIDIHNFNLWINALVLKAYGQLTYTKKILESASLSFEINNKAQFFYLMTKLIAQYAEFNNNILVQQIKEYIVTNKLEKFSQQFENDEEKSNLTFVITKNNKASPILINEKPLSNIFLEMLINKKPRS